MRHPRYGIPEVLAIITPGGGRDEGVVVEGKHNISANLAKSDRGGGFLS